MRITRTIAGVVVAGFVTVGCSGKVTELESQVAQYEADQQACLAKIDELKAEANSRGNFAETRMKAYRKVAKKLMEAFGDEDAGVEVFMRDGQLVVKMSSDILFTSGSAELQDGGKGALDTMAEVLSGANPDRKFLVAGHTDDDPVGSKSKFASNWELSTSRAISAVNYLVEKGVDPGRLGAVGYGEHRPIGTTRPTTARPPTSGRAGLRADPCGAPAGRDGSRRRRVRSSAPAIRPGAPAAPGRRPGEPRRSGGGSCPPPAGVLRASRSRRAPAGHHRHRRSCGSGHSTGRSA